MNVLVTDGESRSALAVTRSLGRKGCRVIVTGSTASTLASTSRFCDLGCQVPDPLQQSADYVRFVAEIVARETVDLVFPMTEQSIHLFNCGRDMLPSRTILACPSSDLMAAVSDKSALFALADKLNVPIPRTLYLTNATELAAVIDQIDRYPVVIKPAYSRVIDGNGFLSGGVRYASTPAELKQIYASSRVLNYPSMIQEKIIGPGTGLFTLYDVDHHLALFSHRRLREKPPSGGVSVVSESVKLDQEMVDDSARLLSAVGWRGVAMVEFKRDQRDGKAKLMEINGRFWGSLQLAINCGVDFPALLLDYINGVGPHSLTADYRVGQKLKWFFGTLDHLLIRMKNCDEKLNLTTDSPSRLRAVVDFLKIFEANTSFDVYDRFDPAPFRFEAWTYLRQALSRKE